MNNPFEDSFNNQDSMDPEDGRRKRNDVRQNVEDLVERIKERGEKDSRKGCWVWQPRMEDWAFCFIPEDAREDMEKQTVQITEQTKNPFERQITVVSFPTRKDASPTRENISIRMNNPTPDKFEKLCNYYDIMCNNLGFDTPNTVKEVLADEGVKRNGPYGGMFETPHTHSLLESLREETKDSGKDGSKKDKGTGAGCDGSKDQIQKTEEIVDRHPKLRSIVDEIKENGKKHSAPFREHTYYSYEKPLSDYMWNYLPEGNLTEGPSLVLFSETKGLGDTSCGAVLPLREECTYGPENVSIIATPPTKERLEVAKELYSIMCENLGFDKPEEFIEDKNESMTNEKYENRIEELEAEVERLESNLDHKMDELMDVKVKKDDKIEELRDIISDLVQRI